jgi:hypothetical protein
VLGLAVPAGMTRLAPGFSVGLAVAAGLAALAGAAQALAPRGTRLLGVLLTLAAVGALTRQTSLALMVAGGARALKNVALAGVWVAGAALLLQGVMVVVGLLWLSTRQARWLSLLTPLCSALALGAAWTVEPTGGALSSWRLLIARTASQYLAGPTPPAPAGVRVFLAVAGLLLGALAVAHRREAPAVAGGLALLLVSGFDLDVPLCALAVTVAALVSTLAAHDPETTRHAVRYDLTRE